MRIVLGVLILLVLALLGKPASAQTSTSTVTHIVTGTVRDSASGEVLPNARVGLTTSTRLVQTNGDGRFALLSVAGGPHVLRVQYVGYATSVTPFNADTLNGPIRITLVKAIVRLADQQVTAASDQAPTVVAISREISQQSISTAQVEAMPSVGEADVFRTLQMLPSVAGAGNGTASLSVRGGKPDQNLVLLDGMTVYHVDHFFGLFSAFNTDALKDIQLYAGGFPARYGGRVSSVIDLTGKAGDEHTFRASGGASLLSGRGVVEIPLGKGSLLISGRRSYTDIIKSGLYSKLFSFARAGSTSTRPGGPGIGFGRGFQSAQVDPAFYFYDFNTKLTYRPSPKDVATISVYRGLDNLDQSQSVGGGFARFQSSNGVAATTPTLNDLTVWGNTGASGRWFRQWTSRFSSDLLLSSSRYTSDGDRTASGGLPNGGARFNFGFTETNHVDDQTARFENALDFASWSRVEFGVWATHNQVHYAFTVGTASDTLQRNRNTIRDGTANTTALYLQHTWTPVAALDITTGVRSNTYDVTNQTYTEPRVSAGLQVTPALRLKGAWGQYHQFVNRVENEDVLQGSRDFWLLADTSLKPQASTHAIVGLTYDRPSWAFNVEAYDKTLDNATIFSRRYRQAFGINTGSFFYTGRGRSRGVELLLERKQGALTGWASYTLMKSTNRFDQIDQGREFPSEVDQRHEVKGFGVWQIGQWDLSAVGLYGSGLPYTSPESQYDIKLLDGRVQTYINVSDKNSKRLPSYQRVDLAISRVIKTAGTAEWRVGLSLYNVANRHNVSFRKFDQSSNPITVTDVSQLGFTPSLDVKLSWRGERTRYSGVER